MGIDRGMRAAALLLTGTLTVFAAACGSGQEPAEVSSSPESGPQSAVGECETMESGAFENEAASELTPERLLQADFLLYNVDCASADPAAFAEGQICGLYQSVSDQAYGADEGSGMTWGYRQAAYMVREEDHLGEGLLSGKWTIKEEDYPPGGAEMGFVYDFQLPPGEYQVTVGFYNPFGPRRIDVDCEGERKVEGEKLLRYRLTEKQFDVKVDDGELNLKVYNENGKRAMDIPILSYIRIAMVPEYTGELLELALEKYTAEDREFYTKASYERYEQAVRAAEALSRQASAKEADYKDKFMELKEGYTLLEKKYRYDSFRPGEQWRDTENDLIQAHGGQVQQMTITDEETGQAVSRWIWVGEDKTAGARGGIRAYSSEDLYNWQYEGIIMRNVSSREQLDTEDYFKELYAGYTRDQLDNVYRCLDADSAIIERPKLIYNEKTKQYVLWFHADGPTDTSDSSYAAASAGVAVSDSPFGPYRFIDRYRLNVCPEDQEDMYPSSRGMARDMNLFVDEDQTAYIIYSSEENLTLYISKLNEEYTYLATPPEEAVYGEDFIRLYPGAQREAPAVFVKDGSYYLLSSGCTGWAPNQARYYKSDSMLGEWENMGDPCIGDDKLTTFDSQSTCVFEAPSGELIYMGDRWNSDNLGDSRYIWLPVEFSEDGRMELRWLDEWKYEQ